LQRAAPPLKEQASEGLAEGQRNVVWKPVEYLENTLAGCEHKYVHITLLIDNGLVLYISRSNGKATAY
jgi:hypothetical protein